VFGPEICYYALTDALFTTKIDIFLQRTCLMAGHQSPQIVVVTGDVTMDWNIATSQEIRGETQGWIPEQCSRIYWQRGGAALLADLIETVASSLPVEQEVVIHQTDATYGEVSPADRGYHHSYAIWSPCKYGEKPPLDKEKPAWRIERFLGIDRSVRDVRQDPWHKVVNDPSSADVIILDDAGQGFRDQEELWPQALGTKQSSPWIVIKISRPVAQGALWEKLIEIESDKLVMIATAQDLRRSAVQISQRISWERTAQDVAWELTYNPQVNALSRCHRVIISFDTAGAMLLSWGAKERVCATLFFDPLYIEGNWERDYPGAMIGSTSCLTASVVRQLMLNPQDPNFARGIQSGIAAMRVLHIDGYGSREKDPDKANLCFPHRRIVDEIIKELTPLSSAQIQDPAQHLLKVPHSDKPQIKRGYWTILEDHYTENLEPVARNIVVEGSESALRQVPIGRFGSLVTVDRREIEALNSVQRLISEYCLYPQKKPLSIAVFGPPGSGKSFGVEQVAKSILSEIAVLSFNLSQFHDPEELLDALHRVRDVGLTDKIPLVFWDEFDTSLGGQPLGWLRYFLAPMQDGAFQEGQIVHPIGRCIFVFAGGTAHSMEAFGEGLSEEAKRGVKLPDFVSRLKGFLNVLGPNPIEGQMPDPYFILRRAIILRSIFERNVPHIFKPSGRKRLAQVDLGILRAFLNTRVYKHGVRSMESIVSMSILAGKNAYQRSSLPPEDQLELHVEARDFLALVQQIELEGNLLEKLAQAAHEVFCEGLIAQGYRYGAQTNGKRKTHSSLLPYPDLPEEEKDQSRGNVRDIANKLTQAGYVMRPARSNEPPFEFPGKDLEFLAEMEHERWMRDKLTAGWQYSPKINKEKKLHKDLKEWSSLSDVDKEKDRQLVRGIPKILAKAGYAIEKLRQG
jgi:hypothetical protein